MDKILKCKQEELERRAFRQENQCEQIYETGKNGSVGQTGYPAFHFFLTEPQISFRYLPLPHASGKTDSSPSSKHGPDWSKSNSTRDVKWAVWKQCASHFWLMRYEGKFSRRASWNSLLMPWNKKTTGKRVSLCLQEVPCLDMMLGTAGASCFWPDVESTAKNGRAEGWGPWWHHWAIQSVVPVDYPIPVMWQSTFPFSESQFGCLVMAAESILSH